MSAMENEKCAPLLDPIERASVIVVGLNTAPTLTGSLRAASVGREEIRTITPGVSGQGSATPVLAVPSR